MEERGHVQLDRAIARLTTRSGSAMQQIRQSGRVASVGRQITGAEQTRSIRCWGVLMRRCFASGGSELNAGRFLLYTERATADRTPRSAPALPLHPPFMQPLRWNTAVRATVGAVARSLLPVSAVYCTGIRA